MQHIGVLVVYLVLGGGLLGAQAQEALDTSLIHHHPHKEHKDQTSTTPNHTPKDHATPQESSTHHTPTPQHNNTRTPQIQKQTSSYTPTTEPNHTKAAHTPHNSHNTPSPNLEYIQQSKHTALHPWIYSAVFLTAYFGDGHYKQGYGLLLQKGHVLTSAELAYDKGMYATTFMAQMQDDSAPVLICVARLHIKAIDRNRGLALLNTHAFTNDFCQTRPESFYHARIYRKYAQNLSKCKNAQPGLHMYYPKVSKTNAFIVQDMHQVLKQTQYSKANETMYGRPFFNSVGDFVGMAINNTHDPHSFVPNPVICDFLLNLKHRQIF
ncbi:hypothetical protein NHP190012_05190 [Helicobacter sp. NHP19-012]|uniref:Periplasmic protein n=1 Tax=Helicobacter gastrofelis TaxID=2849642 RepID=A0ABM7SL57_9HELI|nr:MULTISPECIES: hypothetical protein [unclassified Helicobacter]BCZ18877.1 hypothetical protein NHP190012_05190 [Helicobacter sp. NHP19-012]GMB96893.1 hypothetical protein NHP22001_14830 [Helicobacter sp. NHP22-001]